MWSTWPLPHLRFYYMLWFISGNLLHALACLRLLSKCAFVYFAIWDKQLSEVIRDWHMIYTNQTQTQNNYLMLSCQPTVLFTWVIKEEQINNFGSISNRHCLHILALKLWNLKKKISKWNDIAQTKKLMPELHAIMIKAIQIQNVETF